MKFTIDSQVLTNLLQRIAKAIPAKPINAIMSTFLLEINGEILRITASDGDVVLRGVLKPDAVETEGATAVTAKLFMDLMKTLPGGPVTFTLKDATIKIRWSTGESTLPVFDPKDFISVAAPDKDAPGRFTTTTDILLQSISKTIFAVGHDDNRPVLEGLFFDVRAGVTNIVGSDSRKLVINSIKTDSVQNDASFILSAKSAAILKGILPKEQPLTVLFDERNVRIAFGQTELITRTIVGKYPRYESVIPTSNDNIMTIGCKDILGVLGRMRILSDREVTLVKAKLSFNTLTVSAEDLIMKTRGSETVLCDYDGNDITIGLKASTVAEVIENIESEKVAMKFTDERHALLLTPAGEGSADEPYQAVIMPYQISA